MTDQERFGTLKEEARQNVSRIHPLGVMLNAQTLRLHVQPGLDALAVEGEADARCATCAGRAGTVPGGCIVTQADFLKCILENRPFYCHAHMANGAPDHLCHAWLAARVRMGDATVSAPWPWAEDVGGMQALSAAVKAI